ncbi:glycosyltransferase family 4 protein [Gallibacterium anatis]|uniref:glycosyltransferase family 4 protein n=1 Tax=Gallibacterium anatis TaxID=750 RepID=UPI000BA11319|nr:glycosyltransferase family 4 protein [Gallibacterium anatis]OZN48658.1 glycosyltransferase WbuB [Gallibacterium anatis]
MNILYINHYAGSPEYGMEFRPYYMAKEWKSMGHKVTILSASFSHLRKKQPKLQNGKKTIEHLDGIEYIWYPTPSYSKNGISRVINITYFLQALWRDTKFLVDNYKPDVVIASSTYPMDIWIAKYIAKKAGAKLVYEVHDLWPLSPIELGGMSPNHPFIWVCQWAENYAYKYSDVVVSMLPKVHEHMKQHGLDLNKLVIIPNGIVEEDWQEESIKELLDGELRDFLINVKSQGKKVVGYAGSHGEPNALNYLLEAANILSMDDDIVFVLVGNGLEKNNLLNIKKKRNLKNVYFFEPVSKYEIPSLLKYFDIAYIGFRSLSLYRFGVSPNKLMDYMMSSTPILYSINAGNDLVAEAKCGLSVEAENAEAISNGIRKLLELSDEERRILGENGKKYILQHQTYKKLASEFIKAIEK